MDLPNGPNQHLAFTTLLIDLASRLYDLEPSRVDASIDGALRELGTFVRADRAYVFLYRDDGQTVDNTHEWCSDPALAQKHRLQGLVPLRDFPWLSDRLREHEVFLIPAVDQMPPEAHIERTEFELEQIESMVLVPMIGGGVVRGFVGLDAIRPRSWSEDDVALLRLAAQMLISLLERARVERELARSEDRFRELVESTSDWLWETDANGVYLYSSPTVHDLLGFTPEEVVGRTAFDLMPPDEAERMQPIFKGLVDSRAPIRQLENRLRHRDGRELVVETSGKPYFDGQGRLAGYRGIDRDVTTRKVSERETQEYEARMREWERLEGLELLAGGVAHDFNNLLTAILGQASLVRSSPNVDGRTLQSLAVIEDAARRATELTRQLLAYSGRGTFVRTRIRLSTLIHEVASSVEATVAREGLLRWRIVDSPAEIEADPSQIRQIVMNLVVNAVDAISSRGEGGGVTLAMDLSTLDSSKLARDFFEPGADGSTVACIEVTDDGPGMSAEVRSRVFEPFFTTKDHGRGLGLAAVLGVVRAQRGGLQLSSTEGNGTTVRVLLPLAQTTQPVRAQPPAEVERDRNLGRVLVIDDDDLVRHVARSMLEVRGMKVVEAENGAKGLEEFGHDPSAIDLVVLDMTMPGLDGPEVAARLRAIQPDVRVLLVSGYPPEDTARRLGKTRANGYLQKPFSLDELVGAVTRLIRA